MNTARYESWCPRGATAAVVDTLRSECARYHSAGTPLTVSQAYYRLAAAGAVTLSPGSRKRFGVITARARLAGLLDWDLLADPSCRFHPPSRPGPPTPAIPAAHHPGGPLVEVWTEKQSITSLVRPITREHGVSWVSLHGLPSLTVLQDSARRYTAAILSGRPVVVMLLSDLDPLGHAVEREISRRLTWMTAAHWADAHQPSPGAGPDRRGTSLQSVQAAMASRLHGQSGLQIERVALTPAQTSDQQIPANPDGSGYELEAADPLWLRSALTASIHARLSLSSPGSTPR